VRELPEEFSLLLEPPTRLVGHEHGSQQLHGHPPRWLLLFAFVNPAHAPLADAAQDPHAAHEHAGERVMFRQRRGQPGRSREATESGGRTIVRGPSRVRGGSIV
jgi:hypothetical protein